MATQTIEFVSLWQILSQVISTLCVERVSGPYHSLSTPVIQDLNCVKNSNAAYCVGQPSAVLVNGTIYMFYTNNYPGDPGPNPGYILTAVSRDGIHFTNVNTRQVSIICSDLFESYLSAFLYI